VEKTYRITSDEGRQFAADQNVRAELEDEVKLTVTADQERALIAAGWVEPAKEKTKGGKA
jgi:hypothetical protein